MQVTPAMDHKTPLNQNVRADQGLLYHIILQLRPEIAEHIKETGEIDTIVVGLGREGTRHAGLMQDFGTRIVAGIASGEGGTRVHESIPVYDTVADCLKDHPFVAAASVWRQFSMAKDSVIQAIEAGIPIIVLITEGIPLRDVREMLVAARTRKTLLIGGNSPGIIFPPELVKVGMLPDVFYPEEISPGNFGPRGVTIISRSGAILYHMSDALASVGIAQNAVIGIGGDAAIGSTFVDLLPLVMSYPHTDLVVIAGEIGGIQEERLAADIRAHPERYPKPIVALVSGAHAPEGKTMGHAGAIVAPGQHYGTFNSKKAALEEAGVTVVNSQYDLIDAVKTKLRRTYFDPQRYYEKMRHIWDAKVASPSWGTIITEVKPNNLMMSGYPLQRIIGQKGLLDVAALLVEGEFPDSETSEELRKVALKGVLEPEPSVMQYEGEDISQTLARALLSDKSLATFPQKGRLGPKLKTAFTLGRVGRYLATILQTTTALNGLSERSSFTEFMHRVITGDAKFNPTKGRLIEAMSVASVDHGVTPPSAQVAILSATTRVDYAVSVASGVGTITDVHGGAGRKAALFFSQCVSRSKKENIDLREATSRELTEYIRAGRRVEGLGHRIHTQDPRRDVLWRLSEGAGVAAESVAVSKIITDVFKHVRGMNLPINVDGVIGAFVADMMLDPVVGIAVVIWG